VDHLLASYVVALVLPYLVTLLLTPRVQRWAVATGWLDRPGGRKEHAAPVALLGGVAVFVSAGIGLLMSAAVSEPVRAGLLGSGSLGALGLGVAAIVALGAYDDRYDMSAPAKALAQVGIAAGTWALGFRCGALQLPFGWVVEGGMVFSLIVTVGWIVLITNAFNLIDGIDGLAAGVGIASALTIVVLAAGNAASVPVLGALALSGSLSAFLRYNLPPASIFLGDAGAMGIGFVTAVLSIGSYQKAPTAMVLIVPLLALGVPVFDTVLAVVRRTARHMGEVGLAALHPLRIGRAVMQADRGHIHHILLRSGWSVRRILFALYALSAGFGVLALWTRSVEPTLRWSMWLGLLALALGVLHYLERRAGRAELPPAPSDIDEPETAARLRSQGASGRRPLDASGR
jgi:UDP-GlcNAc:undecaprenyl-phosphate GlcNAc-1-phosphate transferase